MPTRTSFSAISSNRSSSCSARTIVRGVESSSALGYTPCSAGERSTGHVRSSVVTVRSESSTSGDGLTLQETSKKLGRRSEERASARVRELRNGLAEHMLETASDELSAELRSRLERYVA
jgi:hypothetical protein